VRYNARPGGEFGKWTENNIIEVYVTMEEKISVITPSFNQGEFLEKTILSVLEQDCPNIEYIVIDGGSTDNSVEIIRKYEKHLAYWVSEPDRGQSDAINKGFRRATGEIVTWLNSDDFYLPGAVKKVVDYFARHADVDFVYGDYYLADRQERILAKRKSIPFDYNILLYDANFICQPASFFRKSILDKIGLLDEKFHYLMDYEFFLRAACNKIKFELIPEFLAAYRFHFTCKAVSGQNECKRAHDFIRDMYRLKKFKNPVFDSAYLLSLHIFFRLKRYLKLIFARQQMIFTSMPIRYRVAGWLPGKTGKNPQ